MQWFRMGKKESATTWWSELLKEVRDQERRVSMQPDGVVELMYDGHEIVVERGSGLHR